MFYFNIFNFINFTASSNAIYAPQQKESTVEHRNIVSNNAIDETKSTERIEASSATVEAVASPFKRLLHSRPKSKRKATDAVPNSRQRDNISEISGKNIYTYIFLVVLLLYFHFVYSFNPYN